MGRKKHSEQKEEAVVQQQPGEYSIGMESPMEAHVNEENVAPVGGKKKGKTKKGNSRRAQPKDDDGDEYRNMEEMEEKVSETKHVGKKPNCKKGGNNVGRELSFQLLENEETDREESVQTGEGSSNCLQRDVTRLFSASSFYTQGGVEEDRAESIVTEENEETDSISHSLNVSKLGDGSFDNLEHELKIAFLGKKKSSKRKSTAASGALEDGISRAVETKNFNSSPSDIVMDVSAVERKWNDEVVESLKNNKKKMGGKTAQDEDDLDKLLAELGEGPSISKAVQVPDSAPSQEENFQSQTQASALNEATGTDKGEEKGVVESKAAKKRKKKKHKEKEKMAVAAATAEANEEKLEEPKNESKRKGVDKKLTKHKRDARGTPET